jgi:hypothetical protein
VRLKSSRCYTRLITQTKHHPTSASSVIWRNLPNMRSQNWRVQNTQSAAFSSKSDTKRTQLPLKHASNGPNG